MSTYYYYGGAGCILGPLILTLCLFSVRVNCGISSHALKNKQWLPQKNNFACPLFLLKTKTEAKRKKTLA